MSKIKASRPLRTGKDEHEAQFQRPLLRVAVAPVNKLPAGWTPINELDRLAEWEGYCHRVEVGR